MDPSGQFETTVKCDIEVNLSRFYLYKLDPRPTARGSGCFLNYCTTLGRGFRLDDACLSQKNVDKPPNPPTIAGMARKAPEETTYPLRAAARLTGLSPEVLRAWERRYGVVEPLRTPGGTRRYRAADLERLRLVKAAVDAGHRIGRVARLDDAELAQRAASRGPAHTEQLEPILDAVDRLDGSEAQRLLALQLSALGPARFAQQVAVPLAHEIGARWSEDRLSVAAEHLATAVLRAMLGSALRPDLAARGGPKIVFATPPGERHELGLQVAALSAMGAGAHPVYLGADLPVEEILAAVARSRATVLALSLVDLSAAQGSRAVSALRAALPESIHLWIGGAAAGAIAPLEGVEHIETLPQLEARVTLLGFESR